jgi:superfamily II helicase
MKKWNRKKIFRLPLNSNSFCLDCKRNKAVTNLNERGNFIHGGRGLCQECRERRIRSTTYIKYKMSSSEMEEKVQMFF